MPDKAETSARADAQAVFLKKAFRFASLCRLPLVAVSTTGRVASEVLPLAKKYPAVKTILVTYPAWRVPAEWRWPDGLAAELAEAGVELIEDRSFLPPVPFLRWLSAVCGISSAGRYDGFLEDTFGTGGRVCFKIAETAARQLGMAEGERMLALAGKERGADTALVLEVGGRRGTRPVIRPVRTVALPTDGRFIKGGRSRNEAKKAGFRCAADR